MKLAIGPIQYYWEREKVFDFYEALARSAADIFYIGETVCSRRHQLNFSDWLTIAEMLSAEGKEVVLSTQTLLEGKLDSRRMHEVVKNAHYQVEANDMGALQCLQGRKFVAGPYLNIYNGLTLDIIANAGAVRWCAPLEMSQADLQALLAEKQTPIETEVFAYGRMPLAFSARCFTARHRNLPKQQCEYVCMEHDDGLLLHTRDQEEFLVLNGIQTQSAKVYCLVAEVPTLKSMGVEVLRLSPQAQYMANIVEVYHQVLQEQINTTTAYERLDAYLPSPACDGYWQGREGSHFSFSSITSQA